MYSHFRRRQTCMNILTLNLSTHHEIETIYLLSIQLQELLQVVAKSVHTFIKTESCCWVNLDIDTTAHANSSLMAGSTVGFLQYMASSTVHEGSTIC